MYIFGLGNPGLEYGETRHNVGFLFLDYINSRYLKVSEQHESEYVWFRGRIKGELLTFIKPQTYMNLSGRVVWRLKKEKVTPHDIIVVYDDVSLPLGRIRVRPGGSSDGHNGIASIINAFNGENGFARIRIGIAGTQGEHEPLRDYVLDTFSPDEQALLPDIFELSWKALITLVTEGTEKAMARFNGRAVERPEE